VLLTLTIGQVVPATARARLVRIDLGGHPFPYLAGQAVKAGSHGSVVRKPYSIASGPEDTARHGWIELLIGVDERGSAGSHLRLEPGAAVDVEGPLGTFTFPERPAERRFVFIAGGIGIAPLRAMIHHALAIPHFEVGLVYSARTPDDFAFEDEFRALARAGRIELRQTVTRDAGAAWAGGRGRIGRDDLAPLVHDEATLCFICGPASLVDGTKRLLEDIGVPRERIRIEEW
jgi:ferredoxin-NADP reductase